MVVELAEFSFDRVIRAVEKVKERLYRATAALKVSGVEYAIAGGHAVALWVSRIDEAAIRQTVDVDVLVRRTDFDRVKIALESAGFVHRHAAGQDMFLDGPTGRPREAVHLVFAGEYGRPGEPIPNPDVGDSEAGPLYHVVSLEALVKIKLTAYRDKDRTHLRDLLGVGLLDATWIPKLPAELASRLQRLLDDPNG